jgi:GH43 family beta-xylosidase
MAKQRLQRMNHLKNTISSLRMLTMLTYLLLHAIPLQAQETSLVSEKPSKGAYSLTNCSIMCDEADFTVVKKTAAIFARDIEAVTGNRPKVVTQKVQGKVILLGTLGNSNLIDQLVSDSKLDVSGIKGGWEQFAIQRLQNPLPGIKQALVIVGSDRRGTAYGAFALSEAMGVTAWEWWADVPAKKQKQLYVVKDSTSKAPSIKYRGIFINDEDWGLKPWSSNNYEKELGDIGPKTYARVCELLLRLKGNMFAPAMHSCTGAFYSHPESKVIADEHGIIITTSHCEPLLFNNAAKSEWDSKRDGEWNYATNKETIRKKLDDRVREASPYENIYTVGMRGLHDEGMRGNLSDSEKVKILSQVISGERDILQKYLHKPIDDIPQIFVPYKETLDLYNQGLKVPDDVTLVWTDDNYGYIKRLSNPEEQKRSGGSGVYYHASYLGAPHDYLWLCTTPPVLMYEELKKAYDTGADRYWLLNVGDIKPAEMCIQTFFDLAWDVDRYDFTSINHHQSQFLARIFGASYEKTFQDILDTYYRLAWTRKPEFMGWEREWDAKEFNEISNTEYSFQHYNDAQQRLADYQRISDLADQIRHRLPENYRPAFFEMVGYPVKGSYQMNRKFLLAQLSKEQAKENNSTSANWAAEQAKAAYDSINSLTKKYNTMLNGKWSGMMMLAPGWVAKYQNMPEVVYTEGAGNTPIDLAPQKNKNQLEGCTVVDLRKIKNKTAKNSHTLRLIEGIGYDWNAIQLGKATEQTVDPKDLNGSRFEYEFSGVNADSVTVYVYTVPFFPLYKGKSTQFGISVDGQPAFIVKNEPKEFSRAWKDQVLQNGAVAVAKFPVKRVARKHILSLTCGDPGIIIQRTVVDSGGLKDSYVGPGVSVAVVANPGKTISPQLPYYLPADYVLPEKIHSTDVQWDKEIQVPGTGISEEQTVTATVSFGNEKKTKTFKVRVMGRDSWKAIGYTRPEIIAKLGNALHLGYSEDGKNYIALNNDACVMALHCVFDGPNLTPEQKATGEMKTLTEPYVFRMKEGGFGIIAVRMDRLGQIDTAATGSIVFVTSKDLVHYNHEKLCLLSEGEEIRNPTCEYDAGTESYRIGWINAEGAGRICSTKDFEQFTEVRDGTPFPKKLDAVQEDSTHFNGAALGNVVCLTKKEGIYLKNKLGRITNTGVEPLVVEVRKGDSPDLKNQRITLVYSDGSTADKRVIWNKADLKKIDFNKPGTYTVSGEVFQYDFIHPIMIAYRADPNVLYYKGKYYFTATDEKNWNHVLIRRANTLDELADSKKDEWTEAEVTNADMLHWAPELHVLGGRLYLFLARGIQCYVMQLKEGGDPMNKDDWSAPIRVVDKDGKVLHDEKTNPGLSLDMSCFEVNGVRYLIYSDRTPGKMKGGGTTDVGPVLHIVTTDPKKPWQFTSDMYEIGRDDVSWNFCGNYKHLYEGPYAFLSGGKVYIAYSCGGVTGGNYQTGMLVADQNANLLDPKSWINSSQAWMNNGSPISNPGPGHNSLIRDEYGDAFNIYHSGLRGHERQTSVCPVHIRFDGTPLIDMTQEEEVAPQNKRVTMTIRVF